MINKIYLITIGDIHGIGIEIILKLWQTKKNNNFIIISNIDILKKFLQKNNIVIKINNIIDGNFFDIEKINFNNCLNVYNIKAKNNEDNTYQSLLESYRIAKNNSVLGIITLPINKEKIIKSIDNKFVGQTELYEKLDKKKSANMMLIFKDLNIITLTTHIKLSNVIKYLGNKKKLINKIVSLYSTLKIDLNIKNPRIAIAGINPHSGENGKIGNEEIKILQPIIKEIKKKKININGPYSADSLITDKKIKLYDCFIFNYHDQGLSIFKYISKNNGINFTAGLSIIRVSPDHGTAYDIVNKNIAKTKGIINCMRTINKIYKNRLKLDKS